MACSSRAALALAWIVAPQSLVQLRFERLTARQPRDIIELVRIFLQIEELRDGEVLEASFRGELR